MQPTAQGSSLSCSGRGRAAARRMLLVDPLVREELVRAALNRVTLVTTACPSFGTNQGFPESKHSLMETHPPMRILLDNGIFSHSEFAEGATTQSLLGGQVIHGIRRKAPAGTEFQRRINTLPTIGRLIRDRIIEGVVQGSMVREDEIQTAAPIRERVARLRHRYVQSRH